MDAWLSNLASQAHPVVLALLIVGSLAVLVKGADLLVDEAVSLSVAWGVPKLLVGATVVSLGTTLPETAVSVFAAVQGMPGLALGNAVGSIIADTGLILGLAVVIGPVPIERRIVSRQAWIQLASAVLLVVLCTPFLSLGTVFTAGGRLPRVAGFGLLVLLALYIWRSITWVRRDQLGDGPADAEDPVVAGTEEVAARAAPVGNALIALLKLAIGVGLVVVGSKVLIPAVEETALRLRIPDAIIAATLVAFGTSLPELVTAVTAVRKRHGELALGNVIGADILNVLFVSGAAAAATRGGLQVPPQFFYLFFPSMLFVVVVLRIGIGRSTGRLSRRFGFVLIAAYLITVAAGYLVPGARDIPGM